ncbi:hypothetical protein FCV25MIE_18353 [Fagus crenata]
MENEINKNKPEWVGDSGRWFSKARRSMVFKSTAVARGCEIGAARCDWIAIDGWEAAKMRGRWCPRSATLAWCDEMGFRWKLSGLVGC